VAQSTSRRIGIFAVNGLELATIYRLLSEQDVDLSNFALGCFDTTPIQRPEKSLFIQVRQPEDTIGRLSIQLLMEKLAGSTATKHLILQPEISVINADYEQSNYPRGDSALLLP
jgi:DNA-binding LacI/PurR family transcriptional regulator